jgi:hypothetical protein
VDLPLKRYGLPTYSNPAGATVSDPQKTPETLESLAQKLAFTQKTLEDLDRKIAWQYVRSIGVGFGLIAVAFAISMFSQIAREQGMQSGMSIAVTVLFWLGLAKIVGQ